MLAHGLPLPERGLLFFIFREPPLGIGLEEGNDLDRGLERIFRLRHAVTSGSRETASASAWSSASMYFSSTALASTRAFNWVSRERFG